MTCDSQILISNNPDIITMKCAYNRLVIIDKKWLKECPLIKENKVFNELFRLNDDSPWGNYPMNQTKEGYYTLFYDLDIDIKDWLYLVTFLKSGVTSFWNTKNKRDFNLESANLVNHKLGGFPAFDKFYINYHCNGEFVNDFKFDDIYNPLRPNEDYKDVYIWRIINPVDGNWEDNEQISIGWKITVLVDSNQIAGNKYFARKKILIDQT